MVTHSNILVWLPGKPDGQENLAGCSPWGSQRVRHDSFTLKLMLSLCKVLKLRLKKTLMHIHQVSRTVRYGEGAETTCPVWKSLMIISSFFFFFPIPGFKCLLHLGMFSCHHLQLRVECKLMFFLLSFMLVRITFSCL